MDKNTKKSDKHEYFLISYVFYTDVSTEKYVFKKENIGYL